MKKVIFLVIFLQQTSNAYVCPDCNVKVSQQGDCAYVCFLYNLIFGPKPNQKIETMPTAKEKTKKPLPNEKKRMLSSLEQ